MPLFVVLSQSWDAYFRNVEAGLQPGSAYQPPPHLPTVAGAAFAAVDPAQERLPDAKLIQDHLNVQALIRAYQVSATWFVAMCVCRLPVPWPSSHLGEKSLRVLGVFKTNTWSFFHFK